MTGSDVLQRHYAADYRSRDYGSSPSWAGTLESAYEACLAYELEKVGFLVQRQKAIPLFYESVKLDCGFRADLIVNHEAVVEIKCKEALHPVDQAQLLSYLRLLDMRVGLLINFHVAVLKDGIKRMVNNYQDPAEIADSELLSSITDR